MVLKSMYSMFDPKNDPAGIVRAAARSQAREDAHRALAAAVRALSDSYTPHPSLPGAGIVNRFRMDDLRAALAAVDQAEKP